MCVSLCACIHMTFELRSRPIIINSSVFLFICRETLTAELDEYVMKLGSKFLRGKFGDQWTHLPANQLEL
jgi:hypothetical protein